MLITKIMVKLKCPNKVVKCPNNGLVEMPIKIFEPNLSRATTLPYEKFTSNYYIFE